MTLNDLKPHGYHLSDVEPDFRGMTLREWLMKRIESQASAFLAQADRVKAVCGNVSNRKWYKKAVATPRDNYGMKGF